MNCLPLNNCFWYCDLFIYATRNYLNIVNFAFQAYEGFNKDGKIKHPEVFFDNERVRSFS